MASRIIPVGVAILVAFIILTPIVVLVRLGSREYYLSVADLDALKFTVFQALCSASLAVLLGFILASSLARQDFKGRYF